MEFQKIDEGDREISQGVYKQADGTFLAMTFTQSKVFKTEAGALKWLQKFL